MTSDGVRIAYCAVGEGYPVLVPTWTYESLATRFDYPFVAPLFDPLAHGRQLIL
jgi:hypothetical protein